MKFVFAASAAVVAAVSFKVGTATGTRAPRVAVERVKPAPVRVSAPRRASTTPALSRSRADALNGVIDNYCTDCHNDQLKSGNLSFDGYDIAQADKNVAVSEKMIRKLRAEMMPQAGAPRPGGDTLAILSEAIEQVIDRASKPNAGSRPFQRLNRPEYQNAIRDLVGIDINPADYLPLDTKSANFDNIADVQALSPALLDAYLNAASAVSRMAIGDKTAAVQQQTFGVSPFASQHPWDHVDGTPYGTRGGLVGTYTFPADGLYQIVMKVGGGVGAPLEDLDISVDGERVALVKYERGVDDINPSAELPLGVDALKTEPLMIKAGQKEVSVAFVRHTEGPYEDIIRPLDWSAASHGTASAGSTSPPGLIDFTIVGPQKTVGISETPSRKMIFTCRPSKTLSDRACAQQIVTRLATRAYRRPLTPRDVDGLMKFYAAGAKTGGFEDGVRTALQATLASPSFVFRFEKLPANAQPGQNYRISDIDLASRLSFFLWGSIPDDSLISLAQKGKLSTPAVLNAQVKRMLADPRSAALSTRFAAQWLRLQDIDKVRPDAYWFPDFTQQLADDMREETETFFNDLVHNDRSILDLYSAKYTFVNERLARHYGIPNVAGPEFRRVEYPDSTRRGILGQGAMLVQTSLANRTSPVLRGKWVMEVLIGMPPPPPPPNIPALDETGDGKDGRPLTTRERMEIHRKNPTCNACHQYMDPIGLSLDNFDVTGRYRYRENAVALDTRGRMYDGTPISAPSDLTAAVLKRPIPLVRTFTENLMAYATGRRMEDFDQPVIRAIAKQSAANGYKISSFVTAVVNSEAFREKRVESTVAADASKQQH